MQHLGEEKLVAHHYRDEDHSAHLRECPACAAELEQIRAVLAAVTDADVPERGENYGREVWARLRWKLGSSRRRNTPWQWLAAAAAVLGIVFFAGQWFEARRRGMTTDVAFRPAVAANGNGESAASRESGDGERILLVVVSDHLESSERMLLEVANADLDSGVRAPAERAEELVASNRLYRQTAMQRGDARVADLLSDLEPVLLELSHAGTQLTGSELAAIQKRIETKGLLFKVRVISASTDEVPARRHIDVDSL